MTSGYLILNLGSFAKRAEKEAPSFGEMMTLGKRSHDLLGNRIRQEGLAPLAIAAGNEKLATARQRNRFLKPPSR